MLKFYLPGKDLYIPLEVPQQTKMHPSSQILAAYRTLLVWELIPIP